MSAASEYWAGLYADAESAGGELGADVAERELDESASPGQGSRLGWRYYYLEGRAGRGERA